MAKNEQAIREWVAGNRPDLIDQMEQVYLNDALFLLLAIGFEAGREYQMQNPDDATFTHPTSVLPRTQFRKA